MSDEKPLPAPFKVGDTVRLRSGGPMLTVAAIGQGGCKCAWIAEDGRPQEAVWPAAALKPAGIMATNDWTEVP